MKITDVRITPVAVPDVPVLNVKGVHQPVFLRSIIEIDTDGGLTGLSETYGARRTLDGLRRAADALVGLDPFDLNGLARRVDAALPDAGGINAPTALADHKLIDVVYGAFEVALLDIQGKHLSRPVCDLLGGTLRDSIPFAGYLFFKFAKPAEQPGADLFGEVMTPDALVAQARRFVADHGFRSLKLKGGVLEPAQEVETMRKLQAAFPGLPLRIDPMGAWAPETAIALAQDLDGVLEYLEDPAPGMDGMAQVAARSPVPLATNLVVTELPHVFEAHRKGAVQIVLNDHHYWRGMTGAVRLGHVCGAAGMGVAMHSNSHLGISMAAMLHVAACTPGQTYDCDTHYPWVRDEVIAGGKFAFRDGRIPVPRGPGLGVKIDPDALARLAALYREQGVRDRDDTDEIRKYLPDFERRIPRW
ncbi:glucarate dehydratase [Rhodobacteraceae bacterium 2CG4]|uniref:glucarate dehydratase n=1 Tax=Halovulum marinum TaxID=2662447 RepID=A0A6L5Z395_9RHOB|nr:enolase C-terminal domain-like protein [Halovulum marinum]MSU90759.1 glucarate dehydratase [Halovulum marinum]